MKKHFFAVSVALMGIALLSFTVDSWYLFTASDKSYSAEFPLEPTVTEQTMPSTVGTLTLNMVIADMSETDADNLVYMTITTKYPEEILKDLDAAKIDKMYDGATNGALQNSGAVLISQKTVVKQGITGRELKASYGDGQAIITMQMYFKGNTMYLIQTVCEKSHDGNKEAIHYFETFKFL